MCGRYALSLRPSVVRQRLADQNMPADEAPEDDDEQIRQSYNFAPGYHGLIYRAATSDRGAEAPHDQGAQDEETAGEPSPKRAKTSHSSSHTSHPSSQLAGQTIDGLATKETKYKLQSAKWGLIPFWTKRPPDYASQLRTINCRDDSLLNSGGMWNTMKQRKRCIVVCEGFYEWLKKNNGKEKIPHFVKRKDGELMCFAGLWDCVKYEGGEDKLYTYTIITTDSNQQIRFLHDRMPVILEPGSEKMKSWLDPQHVGWDKELQSMLKPFERELECYPVDKAVGKVGNNSPQFVIPVDSKENKKNIANFFGNQKAGQTKAGGQKGVEEGKTEAKSNVEDPDIKKEADEARTTDAEVEGTEDNAPLPKPEGDSAEELEKGIKRENVDDADMNAAVDGFVDKGIKTEGVEIGDENMIEAAKSPPKVVVTSPNKERDKPSSSPVKSQQRPVSSKRNRSATSNNTVAKTPTKEGNARITSFFGK